MRVMMNSIHIASIRYGVATIEMNEVMKRPVYLSLQDHLCVEENACMLAGK
jgi:hypothetical protein